MKKRIVIAVTAALVVFGLVFAMAASLGGINNTELGADDAVVASCDTNGVTSSYSSSYNTTGGAGYKVANVTVGSIADACDGQTMKVTLTGAAGASLGEQTATVDVDSGAADTSDTLNFSGSNALAESVTGIHIVIAD